MGAPCMRSGKFSHSSYPIERKQGMANGGADRLCSTILYFLLLSGEGAVFTVSVFQLLIYNIDVGEKCFYLELSDNI